MPAKASRRSTGPRESRRSGASAAASHAPPLPPPTKRTRGLRETRNRSGPVAGRGRRQHRQGPRHSVQRPDARHRAPVRVARGTLAQDRPSSKTTCASGNGSAVRQEGSRVAGGSHQGRARRRTDATRTSRARRARARKRQKTGQLTINRPAQRYSSASRCSNSSGGCPTISARRSTR